MFVSLSGDNEKRCRIIYLPQLHKHGPYFDHIFIFVQTTKAVVYMLHQQVAAITNKLV